MDPHRIEILAARMRRPLRGVIGAVGAVGLLSAVLVEPGDGAGVGRAGIATVDPMPDPAGPGAPAPGVAPVEDPAVVAPPGDVAADPGAAPAAGPGPAELGDAVVPQPGSYRYEVRSTRDGRSSVAQERREIVQLAGDRRSGLVQISAEIDGERQVSVLDWSPAVALVRSTRLESAAGSSQDCSWTPPFPELGTLTQGSTWSLDSTCQTTVGGIDTTFVIQGTGRVVGPATITFEGQAVPVWQIERDRTTSITASLGQDRLRQQVREQGMLFWDPARGIAMRTDVTVTLEGEERSVTQRTSVLVPG